MKYYLSGPITLGGTELHTLEQRKEEFAAAARAAYAELGLSESDIVNPLDVIPECGYMCDPGQLSDAPPFIHTHTCYMKHDIKAMMDCDAIIMLPHWMDSKGALIEYKLAESLGFKIIYMDSAGCFSEQ